MKNGFVRLIALLLLIAMSVSALASCDSTDITDDASTDSQKNESETNGELTLDIEKKNYDSEFYLQIHPDVNPVKYYWVEESQGDTLSQALYDRQEQVHKHLGVEIIGTPTAVSSQYVEPFKNAVKNKDGSVDTLISHVYHGIDGMIGENYLTDFQNVASINLDADYWNRTFMEDISINDHMYLGFSNFNILYTHVVAYNKDIMDKYADDMDETVYEMVDNYTWTLDKMFSLAEMAYLDTQSDGKTKDDKFGIIGYQNIAFCAFLHSSDINLVEQNEKGDYVVAVYNEVNRLKTSELIAKLSSLVKSDCSWFWRNNSDNDVHFQNGVALMALSSTNNLPGYLNYELNFGVLPYPMYDQNQKDVGYRHLQWGGYICIPSYVNDMNMVGDTLETLSYYSDNVNSAFYEKLLGKQVADTPDDRRMLEKVWSSVCSDFGQTYFSLYFNTQILYLVPNLTAENSTQNLSSYIAGVETTVNKNIRKFVKTIK